jgi:hypothetical protein
VGKIGSGIGSAAAAAELGGPDNSAGAAAGTARLAVGDGLPPSPDELAGIGRPE